jgi:lysophospholipase L1-like esterase
MKVKDKLQLDIKGLAEYGPINIVIFGDSVSHGFLLEEPDYENVYWNRLRRMLNSVRDYVPVNMINASIGGTTAHASLARLDRQVLKHEPDLVIVCFGLNDVNGSLERYIGALREIFSHRLVFDTRYLAVCTINSTAFGKYSLSNPLRNASASYVNSPSYLISSNAFIMLSQFICPRKGMVWRSP